MYASRFVVHARSLATATAVFAVSLAALLAVTPRVAAITYVQGDVTVDTTWGLPDDDTYVITGHVTVRPGVSLTVLPGTTVRFDPMQALFVEGRLFANGFPGSEIAFQENNSASPFPPMGIQFNATSDGSVSWSTFDRFERAVTAFDSSPTVSDNVVQSASWGFAFSRSNARLERNTVYRASIGVVASESDMRITSNWINGTIIGIQAVTAGTPSIDSNTVTNVNAGFGVGIYVTGGASADVSFNTIQSVRGVRGGNGVGPGAPGGAGGTAIGILVDAAPDASVQSNWIDTVVGGAGGNGEANPGATGGLGGNGGGAVGIIVAGTPTADVRDNSLFSVRGGRGGNGGGNPMTNQGGDGGTGGESAGIEFFGISTSAIAATNNLNLVEGGFGGNGGEGATDGMGGGGGEGRGLFTVSAMDFEANGNWIQNVHGGAGGNSSAFGFGSNGGGGGGGATGIGVTAAAGFTTFDSNTVSGVTAGGGGRGTTGGRGGNATGAYLFANADGVFNGTSSLLNWINGVTGGGGGSGDGAGGFGGDAGSAGGLAVLFATPYSAWNTINTVTGGSGGAAFNPGNRGRGGDATGMVGGNVANAWSAQDSVDTVTPGSGGGARAYGVGVYAVGSASITTVFTVENATLSGVNDIDIVADSYSEMTTINTTFSTVEVAAAGNLTVMNYLAVDVFWPNGLTHVLGPGILVEDDGAPVYDFTTPSGQAQWLLVTDRVYLQSNSATEHETQVTITYSSHSFIVNPRKVDMNASHTESFVMNDTDAPTATADALPTWTTSLTFTVGYTAADGNGTGLANVTLWYGWSGAVGWTAYATQVAGNFGSFTFTATGDGTYQFAVTATDATGNAEANPIVNETWTIVDTTLPLSRVATLPPWRNTLTFSVSWGPEPGTTDIATYTIQYDRGFSWQNWLVKTSATTAVFTAIAQGTYQFRSIADDYAGNVELTPAGNDTWTIVDTEAPEAGMLPLSTWQTSTSFLVTWKSEAPDVATFRVQVRDNGTSWVDWFASTTLTSATYSGADGHSYEFRCAATDYAGNSAPLPPNNQTWTIVDVTAPRSSVAALPTFSTTLTISLTWGPEPGTSDVSRYTVQVTDNAGPWTDLTGYVDTPATSASFAALDGHIYAFRSIAKDHAGNVESVSGNDTWSTIDVSAPVSSSSLSGSPGLGGWYVSSVTVNLSASDGTSGVSSISYRIDFGSWQVYVAPFSVGTDGSHRVDYAATDLAGNVETSHGTSFKVDVTAPSTSASLVGTMGDNSYYTTSVGVGLTAVDTGSGVSAISYRVDGGSWQTYAAPFSVTVDGTHLVEFSATDAAGRTETAKNVSFQMDTIRPSVVTTSPRGSGANTTPLVIISFSERMNRLSVESAFSITPTHSGSFTWSSDSRQVTFVPSGTLSTGTDYFVALDSTAGDFAGNPVGSTTTFQFRTVGATTGGQRPAGIDFLWIVLLIAAILGGIVFIAARRLMSRGKTAAATEGSGEAMIDDVFLLYRDGILIKHETRRLKPDIDTDILSGMLTAVQSFVKDSFRSEEGELDELRFGAMHILIGRGKWVILAAMVQGDGTRAMRPQIERAIAEMEDTHAEQLEKWDGNMSLAKVLTPYVKKLIHGDYL